MIRVRDEEKTVTFYKKAFGLEVADRYPKEDATIMYLKSPESQFELELTINNDREKPYDIGDGYGHLAVLVDDLDAEHKRMKDEGLQPGDLKEIELGSKARFFFVEDPDGYKIEVIGRGGRFQKL